jgi:hypothetical protein
MSPTANKTVATATRVLAGIAASGVGFALMIVGLYASGMRCDESCTYLTGEGNPTGVRWQQAADSWQWTAVGVLGLATFVLTLAFAACLVTRRSRKVMLGIAAVALVPWLLLAVSGL